MTTTMKSTFPLILAQKGEILKIEKIKAHPRDEALIKNLGFLPNILIQIKEKLDEGIFQILCAGKLIELHPKLARAIKVSNCEIKEKNSACSLCLHKGSCHG